MPSTTLTASGSFSVPSGVSSVKCQAWGEGGNAPTGVGGGGGGGGGEFAAENTLSVTPNGSLTVTIGTGGTGTNTTVTGGGVTVTANAGGSASGTTGAAGGTGSSNTVHYDGGTGGSGSFGAPGGGGSSAGTASAGTAGTTGSPSTGGTAPAGGGNGGNGSSGNGGAGSPPGGGGGGSGSGSASGGAGAPGQVVITWTSPPGPGIPPDPPAPFTPMSYRFWQPPTAPYTTGTGRVTLNPLRAAGTNILPTGTGHAALQPLAASSMGSAHTFFPATPLGTKIELLINGTWTDVTSYCLQAQDIKITRGRPDETQGITAAQCTLRLSNSDGRFSPSNTTGAYAPWLGRNTQLRVSVNAWVNGSGGPVNYDGYRFWGELASFKPGWDQSGNYRYVDVTAAGPVRRKSQGSATIGSALRRYYTRLTGSEAPYGYWPDEDMSGSAQFASYVTGVPAMGFTGSPTLASDSSFGGSDPIPQVNSSSWHGQTLAASSPPGTGSITQITPGTYHWTCPPGVTAVTGVSAIGAGGGGGAAGPHAGGGGGGGGAETSTASIGVTAGTTYTYTVGAGGAGGASIGAGGSAGGASTWTGDTQTCTAGGGGGGQGGDTSAGGTGGTGTYAGGTGGTGQASYTTGGYLYFQGNTGGTGGASGGTAGTASFAWTSPSGVTSINAAVGGGGGGGAGGGQDSNGTGGGGGGGGGLTEAAVAVQPLTAYTFTAGNGGNGGNSAASGETGGASTITGYSDGPGATSIIAGGGTGGSSGSGGTGGAGGGAFAGAAGFNGGGSVKSEPGEGMGGGGGGGGGGGSGGGGGGAGTVNDPRTPGAGGGNGAGGGWGAASNGGSGATNGGTAGAGSIDSTGGGGGGGGGAVTNTSGNVGGGGGAGWCYWSWSVTGPTGGGGGGGAGNGGAGSPGTSDGTGGAGGSGTIEGGQGGYQGAPSGILGPVAPGGGGGGGVPGSTTTTAAAAANGAAGQVSFSWSGGAISPVAADIVRFLLDVTSAGGVDGTVVARIITYGTVERIDVIYHTASGGSLELIGYNSGGTVLFDSGTLAFALNGLPVMVDVELTATAGGGATWTVAAIQPGASVALATYTGTVAAVTVSYVSDVYVSPNSDDNFSSAGHIAVQTYADPLTTVAKVMAGYAGELAETRLARLCAEEGLNFTLLGPAGVTPAVQAQQDDTFTNVIQSCEDADRGLLFEDRNSFGLVYASRVSMQGQTPALTMDYSQAEVAFPMAPTTDDQYTRNDIVLTRNNGSSATVMQETGPMSVQDPPNGCGDYVYTLTVYVNSDSQLANMAAWMLTVGTVADERFPVISIDMSRTEIVSLFASAASLDCGEYLQVVNPPSWLTGIPIQQLTWGMTETISNYRWSLDFNCVPESPYSEGNPPTW